MIRIHNISKPIAALFIFAFLLQGPAAEACLEAGPYENCSLRAQAFAYRNGNGNGLLPGELKAVEQRLTAIRLMPVAAFNTLPPAEQDKILTFLYQIQQQVPTLSEMAERTITELFSYPRLRRMFMTHLGARNQEKAARMLAYYTLGKDFNRDEARAREIGQGLFETPSCSAVLGTGYPFYGDVEIPRIMFFTMLGLISGRVNPAALAPFRAIKGAIGENEFIQRMSPDFDFIYITEGVSAEGPVRRIDRNMLDEYLRPAFVEGEKYNQRYWSAAWGKLRNRGIPLADRDADPIEEFVSRGKLFVDLVPYPDYIWVCLPAFVYAGDTQYFREIRDLSFTCEPIRPRSEEPRERERREKMEEVVLLYRRNILLNVLVKPMTDEEVFATLFAGQVGRLHLRIFPATEEKVRARFEPAIRLALEQGLVATDPQGRLCRTELGAAFLAELINLRTDLLRKEMLTDLSAKGAVLARPKDERSTVTYDESDLMKNAQARLARSGRAAFPTPQRAPTPEVTNETLIAI